MAQFKPGESGNKNGRPKGSKVAARKLGTTKMKKLLRALEPLADESILTAAEIMQNEKATEATRLKASVILLQNYIDLTNTVYFEQLPKHEKEELRQAGGDDDSDDDEDDTPEPTAKIALFSQKKD